MAVGLSVKKCGTDFMKKTQQIIKHILRSEEKKQ